MGCLVSKRKDAYTLERNDEVAEFPGIQGADHGQAVKTSRLVPKQSTPTKSLGANSIPAASSGRSEVASTMSNNPYGSIGSGSGPGRNGQLRSSCSNKAGASDSTTTFSTAASSSPAAWSCEKDVASEQDRAQISDKENEVLLEGFPPAATERSRVRSWNKSTYTHLHSIALGSMQGAPLAIRNLGNCDVYVLDTTAQLVVDDCTQCTFYVGPVAGSAFLRDCADCRFHVISQQLRLRGVTSATLALHCRTRPIIESCSALRFACWDWGHAALHGQLPVAALSPFHNFWSRVHDFTPPPAGGGWNWGFAEQREVAFSAAGALRHAVPTAVQDLVDAAVGRPTWVTAGERPVDNGDGDCGSYLFVFLTPAGLAHAGVPPTDAGAAAALTEIAEGYTLLRTNKAELTAATLDQMRRTAPHWVAHEAAVRGAAGSTVWGFEMAGESNDAAERRAARYGAIVSEAPCTAAPFRELGMTG